MPARVLLLDLHARRDGFVAADALRSLASQLRAAGHAIEEAHLVAADDADPASFLDRIAQAAARSAASIAVLSRAWDRDLVAAVRRGLPAATLVRVTSGVRAAIDDAFDRVLDPTGVLALASGDHAPPTADYQRTTAADVRRRLALAGSESDPAAPLPEMAGRPTISGPSSGCPFLLDARTSPAFEGLEMDPERIQTKGCSFCLDNFGAYAVPKPEDVIATWLAALRRIREARPGVREVLLTDERPHPYLPAFFEAIAAEPGLGPIELLWKSRADWLLQLADDVERACAIAERSGSVVHLYLMGFESFDRRHLELFNKGHGPEVNEAAIAKMRDLQERYPRSFEHRRLRSHGIVLFTPWTEPEHLLENARWMRRVRFHELRTEALKTRLRLYPRVPLHQLAERDGLLAERFEEGRGDRAAEQGYDASVPWRFRDARTEAVFQLANALHATDRALHDADVLELAARFVVRWPGLAAAPSLAHLPVRAAIEAWGAPIGFLVRELGPAAAAFDPEIEAIGRTPKRAALKESVRGTDAEDMARAYRAMGLAAEVVVRHTMQKGTGLHSAGDDHAIIAVAADAGTLAEVLAAQRSLASTAGSGEQAAAVRALGALMGYPACCTEAFATLRDRGDNLENERLPFLRHPDAPLHPLLHRTGSVRLLAHHLCSPGCERSIAHAEAIVAVLRAIDEEAAARVRAAMSVPSLFLDYERFASVEGAFEGEPGGAFEGATGGAAEGGAFRFTGIVPTGRSREIEALLAREGGGRGGVLRVAQDAVVIDFSDGSRRALRADRPLLAVPGAPIHPAALAALRPHPHRGNEASPARGPEAGARSLRAGDTPPLPAALRPGVRVATFSVTSIEKTDGRTTVTLGRGAAAGIGSERVAVHLRAHVDGAPYTLRKGPWAIDVDDPRSLSEAARAALTLLVRALPDR